MTSNENLAFLARKLKVKSSAQPMPLCEGFWERKIWRDWNYVG